MSEEVILALIGMVQSWGNALFANLAGVVAATGTAVIAFMTWRNNQKAAARAQEIKEEVQEVKKVAVLSSEQAQLMGDGRERRGFVGGIKEGRNQASGPAPLSDFQPQKTDAWIAGKHP